LFTHTYSEAHRFRTITIGDELTQHTLEICQKGYREPLLCDECERRLQPWETYTARLLYGGRSRRGVLTEEGLATREVVGVGYASLKLFAMSVLWRASVSNLLGFQAVSLGVKHEGRIRSLLLAGDPGAPDEYGFTVIHLDTGTPYREFRRVLQHPICLKVGSEYAYRFNLAGLYWIFVVSGHRGPLKDAHQISLRAEGRLRIYDEASSSDRMLLRRQSLLLREGRWPPWDHDAGGRWPAEPASPDDVARMRRELRGRVLESK
jgi:hypothetical protein